MRILAACLYTIFAVCARTALAQEFEPQATLAGIYSDNPAHSNANSPTQVVGSAQAGLHLLHQGSRLFLDAEASVLRREFLRGNVSGETLPQAFVEAVAELVPDRLSWRVEDNLGQIASQPFDVLVSPGRENANVFSTGPDLVLPIGVRNRLEVSGRYGTATYSGSNIDSNRYEGEVGFAHLLSESSSFSAQFEDQRTDYRETGVFPSVEERRPFLRYTHDSGRTYLVTEAGAEYLRTGGRAGPVTAHGLLVLQRRLSSRLTLNVEFRHGFADAAQTFRSDARSPFGTGSNQPVQALASPFKEDTGYVMLLRSAGRTLLAAQVFGSREQYTADAARNRSLIGSDLVFDYRLAAALSLAGRVRYIREQFQQAQVSDHRVEASLGLNYQFARSLQVAVSYLRSSGGGDRPTDRFGENRALIALSYIPGLTRGRGRLFDPGAQFRFYERPVRDRSTRTGALQTR